MKRNPILVKAADISSAVKDVGGVYVFATTDPAIPELANTAAAISKFEFAHFACPGCSTKFVAQAATQPFCIVCGSAEVARTDEKANVTLPKRDAEMAHYDCPTCDTVNIVSATTALAAKGELHCATCQTVVQYAQADLMDDVDDMDMVDTTDDLDTDTDPVLDLDLDLDDTDVGDGTLDDDTVLSDNHDELPPAVMKNQMTAPEDEFNMKRDENLDNTVIPTAVREGAAAKEEAKGKVPPAFKKNMEKMKAKKKTKADVEEVAVDAEDFKGIKPSSSSLPGIADDMNGLKGEGTEMVPEGDLDVDMLDAQDGLELQQCAFASLGPSSCLIVNDVIVAKLEEKDAGEYASMMHTAEFHQAVAHTIKTQGLSKAVANYGFKPVIVALPVKNIVESNTKKAVERATASLVEARTGLAEDFQQAMDISAAGFARNTWKNRSNPLMAALISELASAGVRNPSKIVDRVFMANAVAYNREVIKLARELAAKPVEARNALAESIDLVNFTPTRANAEVATGTVDMDQMDLDEDETDDTLATPLPATAIALEEAEVASINRRPVVAASSISHLMPAGMTTLFQS